MAEQTLEQVLLNLTRVGTLVKDRPYRQVWRFEFNGRPYYLKFYPRGGFRDRFRRLFRGSPALREFYRMQWLQKAKVPSPRAVATLLGFQIDGRKGDALVIEGIEPSITLDQHLLQHELDGQSLPDRPRIVSQVLDILEKLGRANMGHSDLHLGNFLLSAAKVYLLDAWAVHRRGLGMTDLAYLAVSSQSQITRADLLRAWRRLGAPGRELPKRNPHAAVAWNDLMRRSLREDAYFGRLSAGAWRGHFFKIAKAPRRWSAASRLKFTREDWEKAWPTLLQQIESDQFEVLKRTPSGDVLAGEIVLAGRPVPVIIKRPKRKRWYRYFNEIGRGTRPRRAWKKAWQLVARDIPTAWPLLMMEKRCCGYATDALIVFERLEGPTLASAIWPREDTARREAMLFRCGRLLRLLESRGLYLYDSKATNWIIHPDPELGDVPMLIDVDGIRWVRQRGGIGRLLRSLRECWGSRFTRADATTLVRGYEPFARADRIEHLIAPFLPSTEGGA